MACSGCGRYYTRPSGHKQGVCRKVFSRLSSSQGTDMSRLTLGGDAAAHEVDSIFSSGVTFNRGSPATTCC